MPVGRVERAISPAGFYADEVAFGVLLIVGVVAVAAVLMVRAGRETGPGVGIDVAAVSSDGLRIETPDRDLVAWSSVFQVTVLTRRELRRTWFGFEIRTESHGLLLLDGPSGLGQAFLAECHRFAGFDHDRLAEALTKRGAREICYSQ